MNFKVALTPFHPTHMHTQHASFGLWSVIVPEHVTSPARKPQRRMLIAYPRTYTRTHVYTHVRGESMDEKIEQPAGAVTVTQ
jgi:hypothetical protein